MLAKALSADQFKREVRLAAKLQHPHIVPLLTAGEIEAGVPLHPLRGDSRRAEQLGQVPERLEPLAPGDVGRGGLAAAAVGAHDGAAEGKGHSLKVSGEPGPHGPGER
jgi:hypothetical protein